MAESRRYAATLASFRPSVYTTGTQPIQPYTPEWPEGMEYGSAWTSLTSYTPIGWAYQKAGELWYGDEQEGAVGGTCTDHKGLLGTPGAKVTCAALSDAQAEREPGTTPLYDPNRVDEGPSIDIPDWGPDFLKDKEELEEERLREEEEKRKRREAMIKVGVGTGLAVAGLVLLQRYRSTGKVF